MLINNNSLAITVYNPNNFAIQPVQSTAIIIYQQPETSIAVIPVIAFSFLTSHIHLQPHLISNIYNIDPTVFSRIMMHAKFWRFFVGYVDGDGSFIIKPNRAKDGFYFRLAIHLHIDDLLLLITIRKYVGMLAGVKMPGSIVCFVESNTAELTFADYNLVRYYITPIFLLFPLYTAKYLDFKDWQAAILIKGSKRGKISASTFVKIEKLRVGMNTFRVMNPILESLIPNPKVDPLYIPGFSLKKTL